MLTKVRPRLIIIFWGSEQQECGFRFRICRRLTSPYFNPHSAFRNLERDSESDLPFPSGQHLLSRTDRIFRNVLLLKDRGWVLTVQQIKELNKEIHIYPVADVETLGKAHIEIDVGRRGEGIPPGIGTNISAVESSVTVGIWKVNSITAETKAALRPEDPADLKLPG
jgi:hypothetical protein